MNQNGRAKMTVAVLAAGLLTCGGLQMIARAQSGASGSGSSWTPPKTPWGHPDLQGIYTNKDEANTPLERPDQFTGREAKDFSQADLAALAKQRQAQAAKPDKAK